MSKYTVTLENNYGDTLYPETKATVVSTDSGSTVEAAITDLQNRVVNSATPILGTCIELTRGTPYIDFHYGSETESDFTSRIIESEEGVLHLGATPPSESNNTAIATTAYVQTALMDSIHEYTAGEGIEISDYEVTVSGYSDIVSGIASLSESVSQLEESVQSIESAIGSLTSEEIAELTAAVEEIQDTISILSDLSESVTSLDTDITDLQNRVVNYISNVQTAGVVSTGDITAAVTEGDISVSIGTEAYTGTANYTAYASDTSGTASYDAIADGANGVASFTATATGNSGDASFTATASTGTARLNLNGYRGSYVNFRSGAYIYEPGYSEDGYGTLYLKASPASDDDSTAIATTAFVWDAIESATDTSSTVSTDITDLQNRVVNWASPVQTALVDIKNAIPYLRFYYGSGDSVTSYIREGTSGLLNINATPDTSDNSTSIATTAFVRNAIAEYVLDEIYPVGSTYVQLPGTSTPATLFGGTWENISANFNGTFLRVADDTDGLAGTFGQSQTSGAPDIFGQVVGTGGSITISTSTSTIGGSGAFTPSVVSETAYYSSSYSSGTRTGNNVVTFYASTYNSTYGNASEVRPHAHSVRVWQRTA